MFSFLRKNKIVEPLFYSTDIHCHLLPAIDDGSQEATISVELIERMQTWGIKRIIATPHVTQASFENTPETIATSFKNLKNELDRTGNNIDILYSAEYRMDEFFSEQIEKQQLIPMPGNYLLVENSFILEAWDLDNLLFDLNVRGFHPILAHPERYFYYHAKKNRYEELHRADVLFQINLLSLAGYYGKEEKKVAEYLLEKGLVDFIGTDLHSHKHADAIDAYLASKDYRKIKDKVIVKNDVAFK